MSDNSSPQNSVTEITDEDQKKIIKMTQTDPIGIKTLVLPTGDSVQYSGVEINRFPQISCDNRFALYNFIDRTTFNRIMKPKGLDVCNMFNPDKISGLYEYERANFPLASNSSVYNTSFNSIYGAGYPKEGQKNDYFCNMKEDGKGCSGNKLETEPYHSYYTPVDESGKPIPMNPPSGESSEQSKDKSSSGTDNSLAIGLGIGGGILLLIIIVVIIIIIWRRRS